jgi:hypothetical protein
MAKMNLMAKGRKYLSKGREGKQHPGVKKNCPVFRGAAAMKISFSAEGLSGISIPKDWIRIPISCFWLFLLPKGHQHLLHSR